MTAGRDADGPAGLGLFGGTVHALDAAGTSATAVALRNGRVAAIGSDEQIHAALGTSGHFIDLAGRTAIPGINDSHMHATWLGAAWPHTLISAGGFAGLPDDIHLATEDDRRTAILRAGQIARSLGITSYTEPGLGPGEDEGATGCFSGAVLDTYRALAAEGRLTARVTVLALFGLLDGPSERSFFEKHVAELAASGISGKEQREPNWLHVNGVKIFADGIAPMHSAWISGNYDDGSSGGLLVGGATIESRAENLRAMVRLGHDLGMQVGVHATGDRSIETVIGAVADDPANAAVLRHYIIHGDLITPQALVRLGELGMGLNMQSGLITPTQSMFNKVLPGVEQPWYFTDAVRAGVITCLSSDAPVLMPDWRHGIANAAHLSDFGDAAAEQVMGELLRAYTVTPARQDGAEAWKGTLEVGKVADICVLSEDPFRLAPAEMPSVEVELTIAGGRIVFDRAADLEDDLAVLGS